MGSQKLRKERQLMFWPSNNRENLERSEIVKIFSFEEAKETVSMVVDAIERDL